VASSVRAEEQESGDIDSGTHEVVDICRLWRTSRRKASPLAARARQGEGREQNIQKKGYKCDAGLLYSQYGDTGGRSNCSAMNCSSFAQRGCD
jgi:hypothetical protein